jgi:hypothetical protein
MPSARHARTRWAADGPSATERPVERRVLHLDLSHLDQDPDFVLHVCLTDHPLQPHTVGTRGQARRHMPFLRAVPDHRLTHFVELELPADAVALMQVRSRRPTDGAPCVAAMAIHVPERVARAEQRRRRQAARAREMDGEIHPKLAALGLTAQQFRERTAGQDPAPYPEHIDSYLDVSAAAVALLFHHRDVMNLALDQFGAAYVLQTYCERNPAISDVALQILLLGDEWMTPAPVLDEHGTQMTGDDGKPLWTQVVADDVQKALRGPLKWALRNIADDPNLEGRQWRAHFATTAIAYQAVASTLGADAAGEAAGPVAAAGGNQAAPGPGGDAGSVTWTLRNLSPGNGLTIDPAVAYQPAPDPGAWSATGLWSQPPEQEGQPWPAAEQLLAGEVYLKISASHRSKAPILARLVPGSESPADGTIPFTVDLGAVGSSSAATLTLNAMRTSLAYRLSLREAAPGGAISASFCDAVGNDLHDLSLSSDAGYATLGLTCTNLFLRHLGAYVQFLDLDGHPITPTGWDERLPEAVRTLLQPDPAKKYLDVLGPIGTICGVPLPADPTKLTVPVPADAHTVRLLWGGLGTGDYDNSVCPLGLTLTVVLELALPVIMLVAGAAITDSKPVQALLADKDLLYRVCYAAAVLFGEAVLIDVVQGGNPLPILKRLAIALGPLLLKTGLKQFIEKQFAQKVAEEALPVVDVVFQSFNIAVTVAQVEQTTIAVLESPFVYRTDLQRSIDVQVTLRPDNRFKMFPPESIGGHYGVYLLYDNDATFGATTGQLPGTVRSDPITVMFKGCPAGGRLSVHAMFFAPNGWQAGQGQSGWVPAQGTQGTLLVVPDVEVTTNQVPLSSASVYQHKQKIAYQNSGGRQQHVWVASGPPSTTATTPSPDPGRQLTSWTGITMAQSPAQLAYSYQATGLGTAPSVARLYTAGNLSLLERPEEQYAAPSRPLLGKGRAVYDLVSPDDGTGRNFFVDPTRGTYDPDLSPSGGSHLRRVALRSAGPPPTFAVSTNQSWGRFLLDNDRYAVHPKGYVVGISYTTAKLEILKLPSEPTDDAHAPRARLAAGMGSREGLLRGPRAMGITLDGRILVLETLANRIQAFAVEGTPVQCFGPAGARRSWTPLRDQSGVTYLDLGVEATGYLYVLGVAGLGRNPADYFVDVYAPDGTWLVRTPGVTAAQIAVDLLRSLYTLNYEVIFGAGGRPEPSVSLWLPPPPPQARR